MVTADKTGNSICRRVSQDAVRAFMPRGMKPWNAGVTPLRFAAPAVVLFIIAVAFAFYGPNEPPVISKVSIKAEKGGIRLTYSRKDPDGPDNRDNIVWRFNKKVVREFNGKTFVSYPLERGTTVEISCQVTGYDGSASSKPVTGNVIRYFEPVSGAAYSYGSPSAGANASLATSGSSAEVTAEVPASDEAEIAPHAQQDNATASVAMDGQPVAAALPHFGSAAPEATVVSGGPERSGAAVPEASPGSKSPAHDGLAVKYPEPRNPDQAPPPDQVHPTATSENSIDSGRTATVTVSGTVTDILTGAPVGGARVSFGQSHFFTAADGKYSAQVRPGTYEFRITSSAIHTRSVSRFEVSGDEIFDEAVIPASFDMVFFSELAYARGATKRWRSQPYFVISNASEVRGGYVPSKDDVEMIRRCIERDLSKATGGFVKDPRITVENASMGNALFWERNRSGGFVCINYESGLTGTTKAGECAPVTRGDEIVLARVRLRPDTANAKAVTARGVVLHELGHAMGFTGHSEIRPSIMSKAIERFSFIGRENAVEFIKCPGEYLQADEEALRLLYMMKPGTSWPHHNNSR